MDAGTATSLFSELGYVIPTGITGALVVCFVLYMRWQESKQDKDRTEHIAKWDSMIATQKETMQTLTAAQKESMLQQITAHEKNLAVVMDAHQRELDRQFKLYERNVSALESLTHNLSIAVKERSL
jgi:anaerobic C4-dicarboxylate transporter